MFGGSPWHIVRSRADHVGGQLREHAVPPVRVDGGGGSVGDGLVVRSAGAGAAVADRVEGKHHQDQELQHQAVVGEARLVVDDPGQGRTTEVSESKRRREETRNNCLTFH